MSGPAGNKMQQKCEGQKYENLARGLPAGVAGVGRPSKVGGGGAGGRARFLRSEEGSASLVESMGHNCPSERSTVL